MMAAQSASVGEERNIIDPIEQAALATERAASGIAEGAGHARDAGAIVSDQAMRAGVELMQRNVEAIQHMFQCGARLAARLSERSVDQFGRTIGISEDRAEEAAQRSARDFQAIVQSGTVSTEITRRLCEEWLDVARARMDRAFDRVDALLHCRTPQEFTRLQSELVRDNVETFLDYARKAGEHAAQLAGDVRQQSTSVAGGRRAA
jgi:hypothetical protein